MNLHDITSFIHDNQLMFGLLASAAIGTMPAVLPNRFVQIPGWLYFWFRDASKTFMNYKQQTPPK